MSQQSMIEKWAKWLFITETSVFKKSEEIHRLLVLKSNIGIDANNQCIICVDIAAEILGFNFDSENALLRSNLRKPQYLQQKRNVLKLLGLKNTPSCAEVCVQLNLNKQVQAQAENLLDEYRVYPLNDQMDFSHPQYVCMAIHMSCIQQKEILQKSEILAKSALRSKQWSKLQRNWSRWMKQNEAKLNDLPVANMAVDEWITTEMTASQKEKKEEVVTEDYKTWKQRMLNTAYAKLKEITEQEVTEITEQENV